MIGLLRGRLLEKRPNQIILDVGGVGYLVAVPLSTFAALGELHAEVTLLIHTHVREDALSLYGFLSAREKHLFELLLGASGVGPTLEKYFVVVHVDIGRGDKNLDLAKKYDVPLNRGIPAIAVLDSAGKLLFSQKHGEFEAARSLATADILAFLNKWKPASP